MTDSTCEVVENRLIIGYEVAQGFPEQMRDLSTTGWNQSLYKLAGLLATPAAFQAPPRS